MDQSAYAFRYRAMPLWLATLTSALIMLPAAGIFTVAFDCASVMWFIGGVSLVAGAIWRCMPPAAEVRLDADGLQFPVSMARDLALRQRRPWSDVRAVWLESVKMPLLDQADLADLEGESLDYVERVRQNKKLVMYFKSGGFAEFWLKLLTADDLRILFDAIYRWGEEVFLAPDIDELQKQLNQKSQPVEEQGSFTKMWEDELAAHFGTTTFVPLQKNHELRGGSLAIRKQLAYGGLSAVYLASGQSPDSEIVVIKESVVPSQTQEATLKKARELFEREAKLLMKVSHPQIARVKDHFVEAGRNYLVLQYVEGQSLRQFVKINGAQPEKLVLEWARDIAQILAYLHRQDPPIIHRDLTPENIVVMRDLTPVIIDFGAATEFLETATGTLIGKQSYIAPEQFRGHAKPHSDLYALGATMHFLLTGTDPEALCESHPSEILKQISDGTDRIVAMLTKIDEQDRIETAEAAVEEIAALLNAQSLDSTIDIESASEILETTLSTASNEHNDRVLSTLAPTIKLKEKEVNS